MQFNPDCRIVKGKTVIRMPSNLWTGGQSCEISMKFLARLPQLLLDLLQRQSRNNENSYDNHHRESYEVAWPPQTHII